jgi:hypothetical protein
MGESIKRAGNSTPRISRPRQHCGFCTVIKSVMKIASLEEVDFLCCEIERKYGNEELNRAEESIPRVCWVVYIVFSTYNYALGDGLARLFSLDVRHSKLSEALEIVGLEELKRKFDSICSKVGRERLGNEEKIEEAYGTWESCEEEVNEDYHWCINARSEVYAAVGKYCEENKEELSKYIKWA